MNEPNREGTRPQVFVSYSHDSPEHRARVLNFAQRLRRDGIEAWMDQFESAPPEGWPRWMRKEIERAAFILVVCTPTYLKRFEGNEQQGVGQGVNWEGFITEAELYRDDARNLRYIPILFEDEHATAVPTVLSITNRYHADREYNELLARLRGQAAAEPVELGQWHSNRQAAATGDPELVQLRAEQKKLVLAGADTHNVNERILVRRRQLRDEDDVGPGTRLGGGRFEVVERLGSGGFAVVWKAYDTHRCEAVAIKVLHGQFVNDTTRRERFLRGAKQMKRLEQHPGVVRVIEEKGEEGRVLYFVMEYIAGGDLKQRTREGRWSEARTQEVLEAVAETLQHAHERGVTHRDIKPENILLDPSDRPRLTDFDLVRAADTTGGTRTGALGTFMYAAPELLDDAKRADERVDVFSLGMVGLFLLYGRDLPLEAFRDSSAFAQRLRCSERFRSALVRACAWNAELRLDSMKAFLLVLRSGSVDSPPTRPIPATNSNRGKVERLTETQADARTASKVNYVGFTIDGRYRVEAVIGQGGTGVVYRCSNALSGRKVALKVLHADLARDKQVAERFLAEARAASSIGNPHIVRVSDFGQLPDGNIYFVMEFLEGQNLSHMIERSGTLPPSRILAIAEQLVEALTAAHEAQILHRDLKPANIFLVEGDGTMIFLKVLDFGIAKIAAKEGGVTRPRAVFETPHYVSPEQAAGTPVDHRCDIYAVGVILYELVSGRVPFDADNFMGVLSQHMFRPPPPIHPDPDTPTVPRDLEAVVLKCLSKRPEHRYQSMRQLASDLKQLKQRKVPQAMSELMEYPESFSVPPSYFSSSVSTTPKQRGQTPTSQTERRWMVAAVISVFLVSLLAVVGMVVPDLDTESPAKVIPALAKPLASTELVTSASVHERPHVTMSHQVALTVEPKDAHVFNGTEDLGTAPVIVNVPEGKTVTLNVRRSRYISSTLDLDGSAKKVSVVLKSVAVPSREAHQPPPAR